MPTYEYRCENGHTFETIQRMSEDPLTACLRCDAPAERVLFAPAVHFKGSGFYNTDYGTKRRAQELKQAGEGKGSSSGTTTRDSAGSTSSAGSASSSAGRTSSTAS